MEVSPRWLEAIWSAFDDDKVGLVGGRNLPKFDSLVPSWVQQMWDTPRPHGKMLWQLSILDFGEMRFDVESWYVWGCNFSIRRKILETIGGFHPDCVPWSMIEYMGDGETYLAGQVVALGYRVIYEPVALLYHRVPASRMTEKYFSSRCFSQGISDSFADIRSGKNAYKNTFRQEMLKNLWKLRLRRVFLHIKKRRATPMIERLMSDAHAEGYQFHRRRYRECEAVRKWVNRESYLNL